VDKQGFLLGCKQKEMSLNVDVSVADWRLVANALNHRKVSHV